MMPRRNLAALLCLNAVAALIGCIDCRRMAEAERRIRLPSARVSDFALRSSFGRVNAVFPGHQDTL